MTTHITARQQPKGLSGRSPAGRSFAFEFSRVRGISPVLEREIEDRLNEDAEFNAARLSGVSAVPKLTTGYIAKGDDRTPAGVLSFSFRMPNGFSIGEVRQTVRISLGQDGYPVFKIDQWQSCELTEAAALMALMIKNSMMKR